MRELVLISLLSLHPMWGVDRCIPPVGTYSLTHSPWSLVTRITHLPCLFLIKILRPHHQKYIMLHIYSCLKYVCFGPLKYKYNFGSANSCGCIGSSRQELQTGTIYICSVEMAPGKKCGEWVIFFLLMVC